MEEAARTREELNADFTQVTGHLRVGLPADLASTLLTPVFARYCRENASISISITSTQNQPDLRRDALDLAFAVGHQVSLPESAYIARHIGSFSREMYASRRYLKKKGCPGVPQDLKAHNCIRYLDGQVETLWELHEGRNRRSISVNGTCACSSVLVAAQAAREHLGIAMLPQYLASHPTFGAGLVRVLPDWQGTRAVVFAVTADRALPAKTAELIRVAQSEFTTRLAELESVGNQPGRTYPPPESAEG